MVLSFILQQDHLLISLLTLEGLILSLVVLLPTSLSVSHIALNIISILIITLRACEASLGLALLVCMSRYFGTDKVSSNSLIKC